MTHPLLSRAPHRDRPAVSLFDGISLTCGRVHECAGLARRTFAVLLAAKMSAPVFWITPAWATDRLNPEGVHPFVKPQNFIHLSPRRPEDALWCMEEVLRSGAAALVVADIPGYPALTPVRRLHLAAETGAGEGRCVPLGLLLTPGDGGAQGVESRWMLTPCHNTEKSKWLLNRTRARTDPMKSWALHQKDWRSPLTAHPVPPQLPPEKAQKQA